MSAEPRKGGFEIFWRFVFRERDAVSEDDIAYFSAHPDQIDEVAQPVNVHKFFLYCGVTAGVILVAIAKALKFSSALDFAPDALAEFVVDVVFEIGAAVLGGAIVAYFLGVLFNQQQTSARAWRKQLRRKIAERKRSADAQP